jgi:DNA-binding NarL/FixJ family response regulator
MRVLLADDQADLRSALRLLLEQEPGVELIGEVADVDALLSQVMSFHPDLVLLDWDLPELKVADAGRRLLATLHVQQPFLQVIVLSGRPESNRSAIAAGADLFVSKTEPPDRLLAALRGARLAVNRRIQPSSIQS